MSLEVGPCFSPVYLLTHFSTESAKIYEFVIMILPNLILYSSVSGVPLASTIVVYLEIKLKKFAMESE